MTIGAGGLIEWTPANAGTADVVVEVSDGRGGLATQSCTINVAAAPGPSPIPPSTVVVDPDVRPEFSRIPGFDGEADRPIVALTDRSGILLHFVENELIVVSDDTAAVSALAARLGGTVMRSVVPGTFGLPQHNTSCASIRRRLIRRCSWPICSAWNRRLVVICACRAR